MSLIVSVVTHQGNYPIEVTPTTTVAELRELLCEESGIDEEQIELSYEGHQLELHKTVLEYGVCADDEINTITSKKVLALNDLVERGIEPTPKAFITAARKGAPYTKSFVDIGIDVNCRSQGMCPLTASLSTGETETARLIINSGANIDSNRLYTIAITYHQISCVELLLSSGVDPNQLNDRDISPLHLSIIADQSKIAKLLLSHGVEANTRSPTGNTPLHDSIGGMMRDVSEILINILPQRCLSIRGSSSETPLHCAIRYSQITIAKLLLEKDVCLNSLNSQGYTPLHVALHFNRADVMKLLLNKKPDLSIKSMFGKTVIDTAKDKENEASKLLLREVLSS